MLTGTLSTGVGLLKYGSHCRMTWLGHFSRETILLICSDIFFWAGQIPQSQLNLLPGRYTPGSQHSEGLKGEIRHMHILI